MQFPVLWPFFALGRYAGRKADPGTAGLPVELSQIGLVVSDVRPVLSAAGHRAGADAASKGTFRKGIWTTM